MLTKLEKWLFVFGKTVAVSDLPALKCGSDVIQRVMSFKLLGIYFNSELTCKDHVEYILKKVPKRIYFIHLLKRSGVNVLILLRFTVRLSDLSLNMRRLCGTPD